MALTTPPTAVAYGDKGRLNAGISATATTITVAPIYKTVNGVRTKQGFNSTSGLAIISQGDFTERISFETASVDSTTKVTTLSTCTRGLSVTATSASFTGGTGRAWTKGAKITVVADASYFQSSVYTTVANSFSAKQTFAAGADFTSTTRPPKLPTLNQTQEDALSKEEGMIWKNSTRGVNRQYVGGATIDFGDAGTPNATETEAGKSEKATTANIRSESATDDSGAPLFIPADATAVLKDDRIVFKDYTEKTIASGSITVDQVYHTVDTESDAASDDLDSITAQSGSGELIILKAAHTDRTVVVKNGTGNIKTADGADFSLDTTEKAITLIRKGSEWHEQSRASGGGGGGVAVGFTSTSASTLSNPTSVTDFSPTETVASSDINTVGDSIAVRISGSTTWGGGNYRIYIRMGSVTMLMIEVTALTGTKKWNADYRLTTRSAGASGSIFVSGNFSIGRSDTTFNEYNDSNSATVDTTTSQTLKVSVEFTASNGSNSTTLEQFDVDYR